MTTERDGDEPQSAAAPEQVRINGAVRRHADPLLTPVPGLEDVDWHQSYDRESVDRYLAAVEAEKGRLLAEIRLAEEREAAAQERYRASITGRDVQLGALLLAAREEMDRVDTEHRAIISAIHALAADESAAVRERAQAAAATLREVVASLSEVTGEDRAD